MLDLAVAILGLLALVGIVVIVARKFPALAAINTKSIPEERHQELKTKLFEQRLERKFKTLLLRMVGGLRPAGRLIANLTKREYARLLDLERRYRARIDAKPPKNSAERLEQEQRSDATLIQAREAFMAGDLARAEQQAIATVAADPHSIAAYRLLADIYIQQKNFEDARQTLTFLIDRLHVEDDAVFAELGHVASGEGNLDEARQDLMRSIALNSRVAEHHLDLARVHLALGDSLAAFEGARQAVELEPNNPKFLDALVEMSIIAGKRDWAAEALEKLRAVNPDNQKLQEFSSRIEALPTTGRRR